MSKWPLVQLGEVLTKSEDWVVLEPEKQYNEVTIRLWGKGVVLRRQVIGAEIASSRRLRVRANQFILSRIDARNGAIGLVPKSLDGAVVSTDFPTFALNAELVVPPYLGWMGRTPAFVDICKQASEGTTNRVRLQEDRFLHEEIPLPPLPEQQRIVARIESLAAKIEEARGLRKEVQKDLSRLLNAAYYQITDKAPRKPLGELAPLDRRPVTVDFEANYPQVSVRSFGRGTFHKPPLIGSEVTWEKPFLVKAGDILVSNIKAWEGAIAVAGADDDGRVGSHRYLTCVAKPGIATARFVCFHLLTSEGLYEVGEASPGSADRNRTLSAKAFMQIPVPMPEHEKQLWFDALYQKVNSIAKTQSESSPELAALLPSILDKAFKGEL